MASTGRPRYARGAVYGNVAYDLNTLPDADLPSGEVLEQPQEQIRRRLEERAEARAQARAQQRPQAFGIPLLGIVGGIVAAILLVTVLMGYIELAAISGETSAVRSSIAKLSERNEALRIQYESTFDMDAIETYAVNILGMTKSASETTYYSIILADRAEILAEDETAGFRARVTGFLKSIPEYFN